MGEQMEAFSATIDARVICTHDREVDVTGTDDHELNALKLVDAVAKATTQMGEAVIIVRQLVCPPWLAADHSLD